VTHLAHTANIQVFTLINLLSALRGITHSRLIARDMFQDRFKKNEELYMHEMLYPVLQGVDSSVIARMYGSCDLEIGGTDQHFNMLMGRDIMKRAGQEQQAVLSMRLIEGTDGTEKMSKSQDNYISITDEPGDMFGKVMSIPDTSISNYFELATYTPLIEVEEIKKHLSSHTGNPYELKKRLAHEIVVIYHGEEAASKAKQAFENVFSKGEVPNDVQTVHVQEGSNLIDVLVEAKVVDSKSEVRRLIEQGAVKNAETGAKTHDPDEKVVDNQILKIGKRRFLRIDVNKKEE
jgi:tyrosyl-tRNA synthetase